MTRPVDRRTAPSHDAVQRTDEGAHMEPCRIEWLTVPAADLGAARRFYESVFGFRVSEYSERFWVFKSGTVSGGFDAGLEPNGKGIGFSITVADMSHALRMVVEHGGAVVRDSYSLGPGAGYCARFKDPNGNILELYCGVPGQPPGSDA